MSATRARVWKGMRPLAMGGVESEYSMGKRRKRARTRRAKRAGIGVRAKPPGFTRASARVRRGRGPGITRSW